MTDDKGASEWPYKHSTYGHATGDLTRCLACAYAEGRKAERDRCAHIAEHEACEIPECMTGRIIAEKIRGGQDAKSRTI